MRRIMQLNLYDAKTRLSELVEAASQGETVVIAKAGRPLAKLGPVDVARKPVRLGLMKGKIKIAGDFDTPLPEDVLREFEGEGG
ncbi:MAG TPA: type II toxin-antitoxin system prevent-host-death family antitoxin [Rhodanobacteraceae bacterium]